MKMSHEAITLALVETHTGVSEIGVSHLDICDAGANALNALGDETALQFMEERCADATTAHILADIYARLASELIGGTLLELARIGIAHKRAISLTDSHKIGEMSESGGYAASELVNRRHIIFKRDGSVRYIGRINGQKLLGIIRSCLADSHIHLFSS